MVMESMQPGDVTETCADISRMQAEYGYNPKVTLREGIGRFVEWFQSYQATAPIEQASV